MITVTEREDGTRRVQVFFDKDTDKVRGPSRNRCKPEFLKASRIDVIMKKATRTGMVSVRPGARYGDFTSGADFLTTQNRIIELQRYFDGLPSETRNFFANDPKNYLDFVLDPKHRDQAIAMGLVEKPQAAPAPVVPAPVPEPGPVSPPVVPPSAV